MKTFAVVAVASVAAAATSARAGFVDMKYLGTGRGENVRATHFGTSTNVFAGQLKHRIQNGTGYDAIFNGDHFTFCSDFFQSVTSSYRPYEVVDLDQIPSTQPIGAAKASAIEAVYAASGSAASAQNASTSLAAAFQLAVWEIMTDFDGTSGSLSMTAGDFRATKTNGDPLSSAVQTHLATLFAAAFGSSEGGPALAGLRSGSNQDQIVMGFSVPAPATAGLALVGLAAVGRRRR
jgi:uncharacterized protein (TIGR03382 family)